MNRPTPLHFRFAELLRAAVAVPNFNPAVDPVDSGSEWRERAEAALAEFDAKGFTPDEPIFILRGRDQLASASVRHWVAKCYVANVNAEKLVDASEIAELMEAFPGRRLPT